MWDLVNIICDVVSIAGMVVCGVLIVFYIAAAIAIADAGEVMRTIEKWLHRR